MQVRDTNIFTIKALRRRKSFQLEIDGKKTFLEIDEKKTFLYQTGKDYFIFYCCK